MSSLRQTSKLCPKGIFTYSSCFPVPWEVTLDFVSIAFSAVEDQIWLKNLQHWAQLWGTAVLFILVMEVFNPLRWTALRAMAFHKLERTKFCEKLAPYFTQVLTTDKKAAGNYQAASFRVFHIQEYTNSQCLLSHFPVPIPKPFHSNGIASFPKIIPRGKMIEWHGCSLPCYVTTETQQWILFMHFCLPSAPLCASINFIIIENTPNKHPGTLTGFTSFEETQASTGIKRSNSMRFCGKTDAGTTESS